MIPNNTKSGIISIIRFSGKKNTLLFQRPLQVASRCQRGKEREAVRRVGKETYAGKKPPRKSPPTTDTPPELAQKSVETVHNR